MTMEISQNDKQREKRIKKKNKQKRIFTNCRQFKRYGTSLLVQWLRLCAPNAGDLGSIPGQGTRSHMQQLKILHAMSETHQRQINKNKSIYF